MQNTYIQETPKKTNSFFFGVFVLTLSNVFVKIIGLFFKVPISRILGDEGMGYFNAAYTIYTWLYMLSTAGFPVAISILVSKSIAKGNFDEGIRVRRVSLLFLSATGLFFSLVLIGFNQKISSLIGSSNAKWAILSIAPTLFLVCVASALRGYYQGLGIMHPTAISQALEAMGKFLFGITFALFGIRRNYPLSLIAGFSIFGVTVGSLLSMIYLLFTRKFQSEPVLNGHADLNHTPSHITLMKQLLKIAVPITFGATIMGLTNVIDLGMIMRRLQGIGFSAAEATALYGNYTTLVVPMFNLPSVFVYSIAYAVVPGISGALARREENEVNSLCYNSLKFTAIFAFPCALGMGVFSYPILSTVFLKTSAAVAAPYLTAISPGVVFICILSVTNSILQSLGHPRLPIISLITGASIKILFSYFLIGNPIFGMMGAPIGTVACYVVASALNLVFILRKTTVKIKVTDFMIKPLIGSLLAVGAAYFVDYITLAALPGALRLLLSIGIACIFYGVYIVKMKMVSKEDILRIPVMERVVAFLNKTKKKKSKMHW